MIEDPKEIEKIVLILNREFYDQTESGAIETPFLARLRGEIQAITMFDVPLWNSNEDMRVGENEETGELEPLEGYIRVAAQELLNSIKNVKLFRIE